MIDRLDPTRTTTLRGMFIRDMRSRLLALSTMSGTHILRTISQWHNTITPPTITILSDWFTHTLATYLLGPAQGLGSKGVGRYWWDHYLNDSYLRGISRSYTDITNILPRRTRKSLPNHQQFLSLALGTDSLPTLSLTPITSNTHTAHTHKLSPTPASVTRETLSDRVFLPEGDIGNPVSKPNPNHTQLLHNPPTLNARHSLRDVGGKFISQRVQRLSLRFHNELEGVTLAIGQRLSRILHNGMDASTPPAEVAQQVADDIQGFGLHRALVVVRTEMIRAHAEGQLDALQLLGVQQVQVRAEWIASNNACPRCSQMNGRVMTIQQARGLIPFHPNCRCAWIPHYGPLTYA